MASLSAEELCAAAMLRRKENPTLGVASGGWCCKLNLRADLRHMAAGRSREGVATATTDTGAGAPLTETKGLTMLDDTMDDFLLVHCCSS